MKRLLVITGLVAVSMSSLDIEAAISGAGNGGDVVVCADDRPVEMLDVYEARQKKLLPAAGPFGTLGSAAVETLEKVKMALDSVAKKDETRAKHYATQVSRLFDPKFTHMVRGKTLVDIPDSQHTFLDKGCHIEQIVIQKPEYLPSEKLFTLNLDLWDRLDNDNRAALILHEIIYGDTISQGHSDSKSARIYNAYLLSLKFNAMSPSEYRDFMRDLNLTDYRPVNGRFVGKCTVKGGQWERLIPFDLERRAETMYFIEDLPEIRAARYQLIVGNALSQGLVYIIVGIRIPEGGLSKPSNVHLLGKIGDDLQYAFYGPDNSEVLCEAKIVQM